MALPDDMVVVQVCIPKDMVEQIDQLKAPGRRTRSAVGRWLLENALRGGAFFVPARSVDRPNITHTDQAETTEGAAA